MIDAEKVIEVYSKRISRSKWEIINRTDKGIQIRKVKQANWLGIWVGLFLMPFWGIGFILWLLVLIDYALQREKIKFITVNQMIVQLQAAK